MATSESPRRKNPQRKAGIRSLEARRTASQQRLREEEEDGAASVDHSGDGSDASDLSWQLGSDSSTDDEIDTGAGIDEILREIVPERPGGRGSPKRDRSDRGKNESASTNAKIQETYRVLSKEDQFAKAASLADVGALSPEQLATREGYIRVISSRKKRSRISFRNVNGASALFTAWMCFQPDRREDMDRPPPDNVYYPSPLKLVAFVDWQASRGALRRGGKAPNAAQEGMCLQSGTVQTLLYNLGSWSTHLKCVDPVRFHRGSLQPHGAQLVKWRMKELSHTCNDSVQRGTLDHLRGACAYTAYGGETRRAMMSSLLSKPNTLAALRLMADTNVRHATLSRGQLTRSLRLSHLSLLPAEVTPRVGPSPVKAMLVTWRSGKTVVDGKPRSVMCLENLEPLLCPMLSLALYLFWRYHVRGESPPHFGDRSRWYSDRVFISTKDPGGRYTETAQFDAVKRMHVEHEVLGPVVHAARVSGTQLDSRNRVPASETAAVTHMKDTSGSGSRTLTTVYRPLSTSSALSQAGAVRAGESASNCIYFNPRAQLHVPAPLVAEVFPGFVDWSAKLTVNGDWPSEKLTEKGTLDLFHYLRLVLLRGAAALQETHPDFALFSHWPFNSPQFISWSGTARREIARLAASDESCRLQREVSPEVAREIARMHTKIEALTEAIESSSRLSQLLLDKALALASAGCDSGGHLPSTSGAPLKPGWYRHTLPGLGSCGSRHGSINVIWDQVWGGRGPSAALQGETTSGGLNLRDHGELTKKQQESLGSASNYRRYVRAGKYMESRIDAIRKKGCAPNSAVDRMLEEINGEKGTSSVTEWFQQFVSRSQPTPKRRRPQACSSSSEG